MKYKHQYFTSLNLPVKKHKLSTLLSVGILEVVKGSYGGLRLVIILKSFEISLNKKVMACHG